MSAIDYLEACIYPTVVASDLYHPGSGFKEDLDFLVVAFVAHVLCLLEATFSELSLKRCCQLLKGIRNPQLVKRLEDMKESTLSLFPGDVHMTLKAA